MTGKVSGGGSQTPFDSNAVGGNVPTKSTKARTMLGVEPSEKPKANKLLGAGVTTGPARRGSLSENQQPATAIALQNMKAGFARMRDGMSTAFKGKPVEKERPSKDSSVESPRSSVTEPKPGVFSRMVAHVRKGSMSRDPNLIPEKDARELGVALKNKDGPKIVSILLRSEAGRKKLEAFCKRQYQTENFVFLEKFEAFKNAKTASERYALHRELQKLCEEERGSEERGGTVSAFSGQDNDEVRINSNIFGETWRAAPSSFHETLLLPSQEENFGTEGYFETRVSIFEPLNDKLINDVGKQMQDPGSGPKEFMAQFREEYSAYIPK